MVPSLKAPGTWQVSGAGQPGPGCPGGAQSELHTPVVPVPS